MRYDLLLKRPKLTILIFTIITLLISINALNIVITSDIEVYMPSGQPSVELLNEIREEWPIDSFMVYIETNNITDISTLKEIDGLETALNPEEEKDGGLNMALKCTIDYSLRNGAGSLLILPADIPLVEKNDVELIIDSSPEYGIVIVPSRDGRGTNALMLTPPNIIPTVFGSDSFQSHMSLVETYRIPVKVLRLDRITTENF